MYDTPLTALVLSGGGARAAYQVGVLRAIVQLRRERQGARARVRSPFGVIVGTSAGALNAAALACQADRFEAAVAVLGQVWQQFNTAQVYRTESIDDIDTSAAWRTMLSLGQLVQRWRRDQPRSMLDNRPLGELLRRWLPMDRLPMLLKERQLHGLAITASSYSTGEHVTFYSMDSPVEPWLRTGRIAVPARIDHGHLMASSAIPFIFPPAPLANPGGGVGWYGDGSMRQTAPLSPAIHLGAERLLIIGAGRMDGPPASPPTTPPTTPPADPPTEEPPPSWAQVAGHAMASIFLDALAVDIERMQRINRTLALLPDSARQDTPLRPLESLVISPSQRIDEIATRHQALLPRPVRALLNGGAPGPADAESARAAAMASYLLFEAPFTCELMALGEADAMDRRDEVLQFFAWDGPAARRSAPAGPDILLP